MDNLKDVRAQGREAKRINDEENGTLTAHDCPYGPGETRDAWIAGFGGQAEAVEQVNTSTANTSDVRSETPATVRAPAKPRGGSKAAKTEAAKDATTVTTGLTGTAETSLQTTVAPTAPELAETVIGDPAAGTSAAEAGGEPDATSLM